MKVVNIAAIGNFVPLFKRAKNLGANLSCPIENNIRLEVYNPEFAADNSDVKMTAFMTEAAKAIPTRSKTIVNGLWLTDSLSFSSNGSVYGIIAAITAIDNT